MECDGAGTDHSGYMVCELPEDDKRAILTPGVPPERRIEDHEGILVAIELPTRRSESDQLGQSIEVPANNCGVGSSNDCVHTYKCGTEPPKIIFRCGDRRTKKGDDSKEERAASHHDNHIPQSLRA
ncbi:hypothetical protein HPB52_008224 [Rhipicephalus sanguineus]|uniref:Uncharacterized protein n=1 Tax=Rhipicephalus sanguineus TaxID=34632 RepID=A0A9D4QDY1_RHISA|nr:hypothetical protein HPB52_008224 [Rhipicephalus sanguineus]